jgi:hypothetical protein
VQDQEHAGDHERGEEHHYDDGAHDRPRRDSRGADPAAGDLGPDRT